MTDTWQNILTQQQNLNDIDNDPMQQFIPLPQLGMLHISGEEAQSFLQNLLTNDVNALEINQSQLSGFCNAKGRLFSIFLLVRRHDAYQIILPLDICSLLLQRLSMYILRSKVTISDISTSTSCIGLVQVQNTDSALVLPSNNYEGVTNNNSLLIKVPCETKDRYLAISPTEDIDELTGLLEQQWQLTSQSKWGLLDIEAGLASIYPQSKELFTPQQVNLDLVNGVSFSKGCYPGQEIVARLHYLGTPSRRLFLAEAKTSLAVDTASEVITSDGAVAGHIVSAQQSDKDSLKLLLSLKLSAVESTLFLDENIEVLNVQEFQQ